MVDYVGYGPCVDERPLIKWDYYAHPEGEDIATKMLAANNYALVAGSAYASFDVIMFSKPWTKGVLPTVGRFAYSISPFFGCASAFTMTSNLLCRARGKNDGLNYFLGGVAAGSVFGAWRSCILSGFVAGIGFGALGALQKMAVDEGWEVHPAPKFRMLGTAISNRHDFTWMKDPPRGWTSDPNEV